MIRGQAQRRAARASNGDTAPLLVQAGGKGTVMVLLTGCSGSMKVSDILDRAEEAETPAKSWGRDLPWLRTAAEVCERPLESLKRK